jgi:ABC-type lipoprotein export system ATPase subunit
MSGPSGCGKSTLLSIIGLLDTPTGGSYMLNGKAVESLDFADRSRIRNQEIGFIFQSFNLIGDLTVYENVELPLTYRQKMPAADRKAPVMELLQNLHREGATICMVTHDPRFAKHADREVHLFDGKVVAEEELKKLMADVHA